MHFHVHPDIRFKALWFFTGVALIALVIYLSLTSSPIDTGLNFPYEDKLYHALAYLALMGWFGQIYHTVRQRNILAIAFITLGLSMEYMQSFDPNRMAEFADMIANFAGVLIGYMLTATGLKNTLLFIEQRFFRLPG